MEKKSGFPVGRAILCGVIALLMIVANGAVAFFAGYLDNMYTVYEADESAISSWAENAMAWAKGADLISGRSDVLLVPDGTATRAETAVILNNFLKFVVK